jgi:hypothetical protein
VAAAEELSPLLVFVKPVWPLLLPHYISPLDWYRRWTAWITAENATRRPQTSLKHQATLSDLLAFLGAEVERLGLWDTDVAELVRYEEIKLVAQNALPVPAGPNGHGGRPLLTGRTLVARRCSYVAAAFRHEVGALRAGQSDSAPNGGSSWVVFAKPTAEGLDTIQLGGIGRRILELAGDRRVVEELIHEVLLRPSASDDDHYRKCLLLIEQLIERGLLAEVPA